MPHLEQAPREQEQFSVEQFLMKGVGYEPLETVVNRLEAEESDTAARNLLKTRLRRTLGEDQTWLGTYRASRSRNTVHKLESPPDGMTVFMPTFPRIEEGISLSEEDPLYQELFDYASHVPHESPLFTMTTNELFGDFTLDELEDTVTHIAQSHQGTTHFDRRDYGDRWKEYVLLTTPISDQAKVWFVGNKRPNTSYVQTVLAFNSTLDVIAPINAIHDRWTHQRERMKHNTDS